MKLENNRYILTCDTYAAEISSFKDKETGIEYMWNGNPEFWKGRNPILFPIIGSSYNKQYWFDGKKYEMGNHGFTRYSQFNVIKHTGNTLVLSLKDNEETYEQYPFHFELIVYYELTDNKVNIRYEITNHSDTIMPFAFGQHPAFNCPLTEEKQFTDYYLEFASDIKANPMDSLAEMKKYKRIPLSYDLFEQYPTLYFNQVISPYISFTDGTHGVKVSTVGYHQTAVWTAKRNAPFICLEPWQSSLNQVKEDLPFIERDASHCIYPKQCYVSSYSIEVF